VVGGGVALAQSEGRLQTEADIARLEESFLSFFMDGEFEQAFALFRTPASALGGSEVDNLEAATQRQLATITDSYGDPVDSVLALRDSAAGTLLQRTYVLRYEFLPLRARFVYYNNGEVWRLAYFSWDDDFAGILGE
jgi:hypothetical protein